MNRLVSVPIFAVAVFAGLTSCLFGPTAALAADGAGSEFLLAEEPADAVDVIPVRHGARNLEDVVVVGRIGGKKNPWINGMAAFLIVDRSLVPCNENGRDSSCPTPWDYCCSANLPQAMVLVMFADESGRVVKQDARQLLGVKELDTVVVEGKAKRDNAGHLSIVASRVHVKR